MSQFSPPKWADRFIEWVCPTEYLEEFQGDLHEAFHWRATTRSGRLAKWKFIFESLKVIKFYKPSFTTTMVFVLLKNYLKTGLRFLWKTRAFSSLNIFGLALGISAAWLSFIYISGELSFDRYHKKSNRLYRIVAEMTYKGQKVYLGGASYIMGKEFPEQIPAIESATWFKSGYDLVRLNDEVSYQRTHYADKALFEMFDFKFFSGGHEYFNRPPDQVLISTSMAKKLSNHKELTIIINDQEQVFSVVGIFEDAPSNSSVDPKIIMPMDRYTSGVPERRLKTWFDINLNVLLTLKENQDPELVEEQMKEVLLKNEKMSETEVIMKLQPVHNIHLDPKYGGGNGLAASTDINTLKIVGIVGILCLVISCINFSNFSLGNNITRSKEVSIRKVIGAKKQFITGQFLTESFLSTSIAAIFSIIITVFAFPLFSELIQDSNYTISNLLDLRFLIGGFVILIVTALISGFYPSIVLSKFKSDLTLRGGGSISKNGVVSKFLLATQFALAVCLVVGTLVANKQFNHLLNIDLGYDDSNVLVVDIPMYDEQVLERFIGDLKSLPGINNISPNSGFNGTNYRNQDIEFDTDHLRTTPEMFDILGLEFALGRNFDANSSFEKQNAIIVNETFIKRAQLKDPIGQTIPFDYGDLENPRIVGVIKDYHFESPKFNISPLVIYQSPQYVLQQLLIETDAAVQPMIPIVEEVFKKHYDPLPYYSSILKEDNARALASESRIKKMATSGSTIAIILAGLGLLSMVGIMIKQRMKEVSIRKINGATPKSLYILFIKKFAPWILLGFTMGVSVAYHFGSSWLENYPLRVSFSWTFLLWSFLIAIAVFSITMLLQLGKIVFINPIHYLRDE